MTACRGTPAPTALANVAAYVPASSFALEKVADMLRLDHAEIRRYRRFFGTDRVRLDPAAQQADLLLAAAGRLPLLRGNERRVRYLIHARTAEPVAPYSVNPLRRVAVKLGLAHATSFAVSQHACASGLLAVELAGRMLAGEPDPAALALVLTGEKVYGHVAASMSTFAMMGEATAACLVGRGGERDCLLAYVTRTHGTYHELATRSGELAARFEQEYPSVLAQLIRSAVAQAGLSLADLRLILPHNVNRISWARVRHLLDLPASQIFLDYQPVTGHCFCADPFINYARARELGLLRRGDNYLMTSVGLGATFSAMVFRH